MAWRAHPNLEGVVTNGPVAVRAAPAAPQLERGLFKRVTDIHQMADAFRKLVKFSLAFGIGAVEALPIGIGRDKEGRFAEAAIMEAVRVPQL
jgi:hypothetical protein